MPGHLAAYLYREVRAKGYRDETELVSEIVRKWAEGRPPVDWPEVVKELKPATT